MKKLLILPFMLLFFSCGSDAEVSEKRPENRPFREFITDFSNSTVPLDEILSGGPSKDGIPAIDNPQFVKIEEADKTTGDLEPVIVVRHLEETKIYPVQILTWHEIVNDDIAGLPIAVTFCPLCNTGIVFKSRVDNIDLDFGTTGRLRYSNLIMYDRQTETWWQQATGEGIAGKYSGHSLNFIPSLFMSWNDAKNRYPKALVLSTNTGWDRPYGTNPYSGYDTGSPFLYRGEITPQTSENLSPLDRVLLVEHKNIVRYYSYKSLNKEHVINDTLNNSKIAVFWTKGTASALDVSKIENGRDVGTANAFLSNVENIELDFYFDENLIKDSETNSIWDFTGYAVSGPMKGKRL
ncbi:MAG: DUF3179 domain-containing protein, partial [Spirochaetales bacterium]|nr:DUF3179 domain-containing protein [Spirochaetales bacterium]